MPKHDKKRRAIAIGTILLLIVAAMAGSALAYMAGRDKGVNVVTIGNVHISASEPGFPTKDSNGNGVPDECELVIPYKTVLKDPRIKNTGKNDAVVFLKVTAPVEEISLITDDDVRQEAALSDLFWFKQKKDPDSMHQNNFHSSWTRLTTLDGEFVNCKGINDEGRGYTYIFGYHTRIKAGESTATLFDKVQNKKYGSKTIGPNEMETIRIESYAIQADEIERSGVTVDTSADISKEDLTYIYRTFFNQNQDNLE